MSPGDMLFALALALGSTGTVLLGLALWMRARERRLSAEARDLDGIPWTRLEAQGPGRVVEARTLRVDLPPTYRRPLAVPGVRGGVAPATLLVRTVLLEWTDRPGGQRARFRTHHLLDDRGREMTSIYASGKRDLAGERTRSTGWFTESRGVAICEELVRRGGQQAETIATFQPVGQGLVLASTSSHRHRRSPSVVHALCSAGSLLEPMRQVSAREAAALQAGAMRRAA